MRVETLDRARNALLARMFSWKGYRSVSSPRYISLSVCSPFALAMRSWDFPHVRQDGLEIATCLIAG